MNKVESETSIKTPKSVQIMNICNILSLLIMITCFIGIVILLLLAF